MERAEGEAQAERAVRRGQIREALDLYAQLARTFPEDLRIKDRLAQLQASLHPSEIVSGTRTGPENRGAHMTPEQEGEQLFAQGDYVGAAAAYRKAVGERPDNELLRERLEEIYHLATARHEPQTDRFLQELLSRIASRRRSSVRRLPR